MQNRKVLFLCRSLGYGGAQAQLVELAIGLHQRHHPVVVASFYDGHLRQRLCQAEVPVVLLGKRGRWDLCSFFWRLLQVLRAEKPDILHGYLAIPNLMALLLKPASRHSQVVWGIRATTGPKDESHWMSILAQWLEGRLSAAADRIIINSQAGWAACQSRAFHMDHAVVIFNGIDVDRFHPDASAGQAVREEWQIAPHEKLIGIVGRLDPVKGHPVFLKAAALLAARDQNVRFTCIGDGAAHYRARLFALASELGLRNRLWWAGARQDMCAVYNALDLATLASASEGFPNVLGEAMACGTPCVATDAGDAAEIIADTGGIVLPGEPQQLANAWHAWLQQDKGQAGARARARIVDHFSLQQMIERTEAALCLTE